MARPNVLFLLTDDQRFDTIGALGNPHVHTPHLDALVARGTAFERCHIMGGTTGAVCMPSRAMTHTGRHLFSLQNNGKTIPADHALLGETLRSSGYQTCGIGKWHNGEEAFHRSFEDGGCIFFGGMADHWNVPAHRYDPTGAYDGSTSSPGKGNHSTIRCAAEAVEFFKRRDTSRPFFCSVSFLAPHDPRTMPEEFLLRYRDNPPPLPDNFLPAHLFDNGELNVRDELLADHPRIPGQIQRQLGEYYAMIDHLDHAIGRILTALEHAGELDNTLIVFSGDNGLAMGQHGLMGKQSCYDHSLRVPLVFAGPGIPADARRRPLCYLHDLFPTLCDYLDLPTPSSVESQSLLPAIRDDSPHRDHLFCGYRHLMRTVTRDDGWKLIRSRTGSEGHTQLFHLPEDPLEMRNRSDDPACATVADDLAALLRDEAAACGDPFADDILA